MLTSSRIWKHFSKVIFLYDFGIICEDFSYLGGCEFISAIAVCCSYLLMLLLCVVVICCFKAQVMGRWYVGQQERVVVEWLTKVLGFLTKSFGKHFGNRLVNLYTTFVFVQREFKEVCNILNKEIWYFKFGRINNNFNLFQVFDGLCVSVYKIVWFGLVSLFNGISRLVGYLMPQPS